MPNDLPEELPSLDILIQRLRAKRAQNPGARPRDARGAPTQVQIPGEAPIQAQPVGPPRVSARVGEPVMQMDPMRIPVDRQLNPQAAMDPRAARLRALMSQGLNFEQAMRSIQQGG